MGVGSANDGKLVPRIQGDSESVENWMVVPKLKGWLKDRFVYFGRIKWILIDKKNQLSSETQKGLEKLEWVRVADNVFESPWLGQYEKKIGAVMDIVSMDQCVDGVEIFPTYGSVSCDTSNKENK
jgi:hypothetical protein